MSALEEWINSLPAGYIIEIPKPVYNAKKKQMEFASGNIPPEVQDEIRPRATTYSNTMRRVLSGLLSRSGKFIYRYPGKYERKPQGTQTGFEVRRDSSVSRDALALLFSKENMTDIFVEVKCGSTLLSIVLKPHEEDCRTVAGIVFERLTGRRLPEQEN